MSYIYYDNTKKKYVFSYLVRAQPGSPGTKKQRKRLFFKLKKDALRCQKIHNTNQVSYGNISDFDLTNYQRLLDVERYADGLDLVKAVDYYRASYRVATEKVFKDLVKPYIKSKKAKNVSNEWMITIKGYLEKLISRFGSSRIDAITREQLEEYIHELPYSVSYKDNVRRFTKNYFKYAKSLKWIKEDPAKDLEPIIDESKEIKFISCSNTLSFFNVLKKQSPELIPYNCIRAFAGIRTSHVKRLTWDDINFEERGIRIKDGGKADLDFLQGHPENLWVWLKAYRKYKIFPSKADRCTGLIIKINNIHNPRNGFRHSFGTHHVALFKDIALTSHLMQHDSPRTTKRFYKGVVSEGEAEKYFSII